MEFNKSLEIDLDKSIYELRQMAMDNGVDIEELLRKAYLISITLKQKDIEKWINNEQNGYKDVDNIPEYRFLQGDLKVYNFGKWTPMKFSKKEQAEILSNIPVAESIAEIVETYKNSIDGIVTYSITDVLTQSLNKNGSFASEYKYFVSTGQLRKVFSSIQNKILQWTIELEESGYMNENDFKDNIERKSGNDKESGILSKVNIFLSYCWNDSSEADKIYNYFKSSKNVELHRDTINIKKWGSIKEYMKSIRDMDYTIILISDAYLKSANCMYEILEVMQDRNYEGKIFPAVICSEIYRPITRAKYVKHWQDEFRALENTLKGIEMQNLGDLNEDLKRIQDISSNIAKFLDMVSDMNNPNIEDVCLSIEEKLNQKDFFGNSQIKDEKDLFSTLEIPKTKYISEPTDLEKNQFIRDSFKHIIKLLSQLCQQYQEQNAWIQVQIEQVDARTVVYQFYKNGQLVRGLKLFLGNMFNGGRENIGLSDNTMSFGGGNSWNGMYDAKFIDGELKLYATMSYVNGQKTMEVEEVVRDIWEHYIQIYLER